VATRDRAAASRVWIDMRHVLVCAVLLGCGGGGAAKPPSDGAHAPAPAAVFDVTVTTQELGAGVGPRETIELDGSGTLRYQIGKGPAPHVTVAADRVARIAALLTDPSLPASTSSEPRGEGTRVTLKVSGPLALDIHFQEDAGPAAATALARALVLLAYDAEHGPRPPFHVILHHGDLVVSADRSGDLDVTVGNAPTIRRTLTGRDFAMLDKLLGDPGVATARADLAKSPEIADRLEITGYGTPFDLTFHASDHADALNPIVDELVQLAEGARR
jgi:hypothetical protein